MMQSETFELTVCGAEKRLEKLSSSVEMAKGMKVY